MLTGLVIAKNDERTIRDCLNSLKWVDEIIVVVDAASTDATAEYAKEFTERVFINPWEGFGPQKNFAMEQASGPWVLILHATERVSDVLAETVRRLLRDDSDARIAGYRIPRRNYFYGRWMQHGGMFPDRQIRFFRKEKGRYDDTLVHEHLVLHGDIEDMRRGVYLDHCSSPTIRHHFRKVIQYTSLGAREKLKTIREVTYLKLLGHPVGTMFKTVILRQGWKDGVHGCVAAMFAGFYTFVKYAKAYEILKSVSSGSGGNHGADRL
ncbi:MAG: glycosyltransferase family 2 protein [Nitrospira sp.]|nr:glycosyltransferase family 2 protein [Nitrospira sp.]